MKKILVLLFVCQVVAHAQERTFDSTLIKYDANIDVGAERSAIYLHEFIGKRVGLVVNQSSMVGSQHLVDFLLERDVNVVKVFAPEHGFRGAADAGEKVKDATDPKTGLSIISLYGKNKKPSSGQLKNIDVLVFDIQDVGVRFYTYISTMSYLMQACAENDKKLVILDRPNPNGFYVDGPVLAPSQKSFVGVHSIPVVHGMTVGELALMINKEGWLGKGLKCKLNVVMMSGYAHNYLYQLPIKPSPNLPNMTSVYLYPSLGIFEGTNVSVGRGTDFPFQVYGSPYMSSSDNFEFTPRSTTGAKNPKYNGQTCFGYNLQEFDLAAFYADPQFNVGYVQLAYQQSSSPENFFLKNKFFNLLSGNETLMNQIKNGADVNEIKASWSADLESFKAIRKKYLLYPGG